MTKSFRLEKDSLGTIKVNDDSLWGAQTQRSLNNFAIGNNRMPLQIIYSLAHIKKASAIANHKLGIIDEYKKDLIISASSEILDGQHNEQFPLNVWQTGSGTHTNMNVNEVICNLASQKTHQPLGSHQPLHPNDHVNCSQSTNDVFPAAIQIAVINDISKNLLPELNLLFKSLAKRSTEWNSITKIGRTHLQDAVPLTLGQEVSAWRDQIDSARLRIQNSLKELYELPLGGTAVGTGLNAPKSFDREVAIELAQSTGFPLSTTNNKFALMASHDGLVNVMTQLKMLAVALLKITNDIRLLSSGPRSGLSEIELPENEPGSSIMPGKTNPTQCEAMSMVCLQVIGLEVAVTMGGSGGHLQMNAYKPLIGFNLIQSIELLSNACQSYRELMIENMTPNLRNIQSGLNKSLMLVTALSPAIGYKKASEIAQYAHKKNLTLKTASEELGYINNDDFDKLVDPTSMTQSQ